MEIQDKKYLKDGFPTPSGMMELESSILQKYSSSHGYSGLPLYQPPKYSHESAPEEAKKYPFILNTGSRLPMFIHSRSFRLPWARGLRPKPSADINPVDAENLNINHGDRVEIFTPKGFIRVWANLTETV